MILATTSIAAWLVFATATPSNASQTVTAIPFVSFEFCERRMERTLRDLLATTAPGPDRRPITIKPFCTTIAPAFWIAPREAF